MTIQQYGERIQGLDSEQVLLSSYFNLETTRAPSAIAERQRIEQLASSGDLDAALELLQTMSGGTVDDPISHP